MALSSGGETSISADSISRPGQVAEYSVLMEGGEGVGGWRQVGGRGGEIHRDHGLSLYTIGTFLYCPVSRNQSPWKFLLGEKVDRLFIFFNFFSLFKLLIICSVLSLFA